MVVEAAPPQIIIVVRQGSAGLIAGLFSCFFGFVGIFVFALFFVPIALVCAAIGFLRGVFGKSAVGIGVSLLGFVVTIFAAMTSPTILLLFGISTLAALLHSPAAQPPTVQQPVVQAAPDVPPRPNFPTYIPQRSYTPPPTAQHPLASYEELLHASEVIEQLNSKTDLLMTHLRRATARMRELAGQPERMTSLHSQGGQTANEWTNSIAQAHAEAQSTLDACKFSPAATAASCGKLLAQRDAVNEKIKVVAAGFKAFDLLYREEMQAEQSGEVQ